MGRSQWAEDVAVMAILAMMYEENALACEVSMRYGMRIGDVLRLTREQVERGVVSYTEQKTGKRRRVTIDKELCGLMLDTSNRYICRCRGTPLYVFPHRIECETKSRTRQAVYKDVKRVAAMIHKRGISPHSFRKVYAVKAYHRYRDIKRVQKLLNHSDEAVTMIYALADELTSKD